jgi:hypothetical protein
LILAISKLVVGLLAYNLHAVEATTAPEMAMLPLVDAVVPSASVTVKVTG